MTVNAQYYCTRQHSVTILDYQQGFSVCFYLYQWKLNKRSGIYIDNTLTDYFGWPNQIDVKELGRSAMGQSEWVMDL